MAKLSKYQKEFGEALYNLGHGLPIASGVENKHIILDAKAGSGKTFTITYFMKYIPVTQRVVALMFNKRNAEDIQAKLPKTGNCEGMTTHSLGLRALRKAGVGRIDGDKMRGILNGMQMSFPERQLFPQIRKLVSVAKALGIVPSGYRGATSLLPDSEETWQGIIDHYSIDFDEPWQQDAALGFARTALRLSMDNSGGPKGLIDFDDMIYLPVVMRIGIPKYDWVFIDEAQDINPVQRELVKRAIGPNGHLVAVGDPNQAIYGFRGADSESMDKIRQEVNAHVMPLSICYRCDKEIVREARKVVPTIEYQETREDGAVRQGFDNTLTREQRLALFAPDSAILCPFNAPLVQTAFSLIRGKIACRMVGRNFAQGLVKLLQRLDAATAHDAEKKLDHYYIEELARLGDNENKIQALQDKCDTLRVFLSEAPANETVDRVIASINSLFNLQSGKAVGENGEGDRRDLLDAQGMLTLSSIHRAKGGEWPRVFLMDSHFLGMTSRKRGDRMVPLLPWEIQQKRNLLYVAITRSVHELIYCTAEEIAEALR